VTSAALTYQYENCRGSKCQGSHYCYYHSSIHFSCFFIYGSAAELLSTFHNDTSSIIHESTCPVSTPVLNPSDGQLKWTYSQFDILCTGQSVNFLTLLYRQMTSSQIQSTPEGISLTYLIGWVCS